MEPATNRIKRLLEVLSTCSFNLYYIKGKDMVLSDYDVLRCTMEPEPCRKKLKTFLFKQRFNC